MSLILGIYSKKEKIDKKDVKAVLEDFSLDKRRKLQTICNNKIILSEYENPVLSDINKAETNGRNIVENEDKSLIIIFGGEVYDFEDEVHSLIKKDHQFKNKNNCAEFILHSYEEFGDSFLKALNGTFAFAIYDKLKDELILGNDSFGIYPLFIFNSDDYIIFCSEYQPITKYKKFDKKLSYDAIAEYFTLGLPLGDKTFFKDIINLHPGSLLKIRKNKINLKQYDNLRIKINKNNNINFFAKEISKIIYKATQARVKYPRNIKCALSGGADTRLILGNLTEEQKISIEFFTNGSPWLNEEENKDVIIAKMLAKRFNLRHVINKRNPKQVRDFGISFFERRRKIKLKKKILMGWGGGEFLGGSCFDSSPINLEKVKKDEVEIKLKRIFNESFLKNVSNPYSSLKKEFKKIKAENKKFLFNIHQVTRGFFTARFGGSRAGWLDPYTHALRVDSIFWDKNLLKFLLTVPKENIIDRKLYRTIYNNHFPHLLEIPTTREDMNPLTFGKNQNRAKRPKYGKALKVYIKSHYTFDKQIYNSEYIKSKSNDENCLLIKQFIDFEAWYRKFAL